MHYDQMSTLEKIKELKRVYSNLLKAIEECKPYSSSLFHPGSEYLRTISERINELTFKYGQEQLEAVTND